MSTIRSRVIIASASMLGGALLAAGILVYSSVRTSLIHEFDAALAAHAQALTTNVELDVANQAYEYHGTNQIESGMAFVIRTRDGRTLAATGDQTLIVDSSTALGPPQVTGQHLADGRTTRQMDVWSHSLIEGSPTPVVGAPDLLVRIARDRASLDGRITGFAHLLMAVGIGVMILAMAVLAIGLRAALRPLDRLTAQISAVDARSLCGRIDAKAAPDELVPTVSRLNQLLDRIQDSVRREQLYNAAIAHELRTPLGALQTILDVHRGREHPVEAYVEALELCHGISMQMRRLVHGLLLLAKVDAGQLCPVRESVQLAHAANAAWATVAQVAKERAIQVHWQIPPDLQVRTDSSLLAIVLANLLDNAVSHGSSGGTITMVARSDPNWITFEVSNQGCSLVPDQMAHIFDRFWRGDHARARSDQHAGLGLSLCQEAVSLLGGRITATCVEDHFRMRVDVPQQAPAVQHSEVSRQDNLDWNSIDA